MELIDVFDENENFLNYSVDRKEVHEKNLWHRHASAWIMNHDGLILLQQRAFDKKKNPGKWAKTGGHVDAGETCVDALKREVYEEIGIKINDEDMSIEQLRYLLNIYIESCNINEKDDYSKKRNKCEI